MIRCGISLKKSVKIGCQRFLKAVYYLSFFFPKPEYHLNLSFVFLSTGMKSKEDFVSISEYNRGTWVGHHLSNIRSLWQGQSELFTPGYSSPFSPVMGLFLLAALKLGMEQYALANDCR